MGKQKDWFKIKRYPHIGLPLKAKDRFKWIEQYITNPEEIAKHAFLPFIHKVSRVRKFRKDYSPDDGKLNEKYKKGKKVLRKSSEKTRELYYASHLDSLVFGYYAFILSNKYEEKIAEFNLNEVVNAYRSVKIDNTNPKSSNKCNIDFANDVFKYIQNYPKDEFSVIAFDISSFFDNLNHKLLRATWCDVLNTERLDPDHFNVFKNITRFRHVDIIDIFEEFKNKILIRKFNIQNQKFEYVKKNIHKIRFLRNQNAAAFCTEKDFFKLKDKLLQPTKFIEKDNGSKVKRDYGIPQGSPISSVLANIYLLHFDKTINEYMNSNEGIYRRYSDDMVVVCPTKNKEQLLELVYSEIKKYRLEIQETKTQIFQFIRENDKLKCGQQFGTNINWNKKFQYLGFEFDGEYILLKSSSLSGYYRKMKRSIRRAKHFSKSRLSKTNGEIFKRRLFKKFSYKGAKRTRKWIWNEAEKQFKKSESYNWGNFLSYAKKASQIMIKNKIAQQTKRHWSVINKLLK